MTLQILSVYWKNFFKVFNIKFNTNGEKESIFKSSFGIVIISLRLSSFLVVLEYLVKEFGVQKRILVIFLTNL